MQGRKRLGNINVVSESGYAREGLWKSYMDNGVPWVCLGSTGLSEEWGTMKASWAGWQRGALILTPPLHLLGHKPQSCNHSLHSGSSLNQGPIFLLF